MNRQTSLRQSGFTLIEILIALAIFAIIGVTAAACLHEMIVFRTRMAKETDRWRELAIVRLLIQKDFQNAIVLKSSDFNATNFLSFSGDANQFSLTRWNRAGASLLDNASIFMSVQYALQGNILIRTVTDSQGHPIVMPIMDNVQTFKCDYLNAIGQWQSSWQGDTNTNSYSRGASPMTVSTIPHVMRVKLALVGVAGVQWVFSKPAVSG